MAGQLLQLLITERNEYFHKSMFQQVQGCCASMREVCRINGSLWVPNSGKLMAIAARP
jgi:hypothetical protein